MNIFYNNFINKSIGGKNETHYKKIIALLASAVTAVTTLSASYSAVFAETQQESAASSAESDYEIKSGHVSGKGALEELMLRMLHEGRAGKKAAGHA